jgi:uncharacterized protein (TIGR00251 family)
MPGWYAWQGNNLLLSVSIQPRARQNDICGVHGDALKIRITAPPVDGKANAHLTAYLAELCQVSKSAVTVISGETSRHKRVRIQLQKPILPEAFEPFC